MLFALLVFRFDYTSVSAVSILLGTVVLCAALFEAVAAAGTHGWWRVAHIGLAIAFAVIGTLAFIHPENTFSALASIFAFYLFLRGIFDIVVALYARPGRALVGRARLGGADPARVLGGRRLREQGVPADRLGRRLGAGPRRRPDRDGIPPPAQPAAASRRLTQVPSSFRFSAASSCGQDSLLAELVQLSAARPGTRAPAAASAVPATAGDARSCALNNSLSLQLGQAAAKVDLQDERSYGCSVHTRSGTRCGR